MQIDISQCLDPAILRAPFQRPTINEVPPPRPPQKKYTSQLKPTMGWKRSYRGYIVLDLRLKLLCH